MPVYSLVNIGSGNGLLPDGTKPLPDQCWLVICRVLCHSEPREIICQNGSADIHYNDVIMSTIASQITSLTIIYSSVKSGADERKHQSSASLAFVRGIHRWPVNSPHKGPVSRKMFPFDDVIMLAQCPRTHFTGLCAPNITESKSCENGYLF